METARILLEGDGQIIRLPESCCIKSDEVLVNRIGEIVMLVPKGNSLAGVLASLDMFTEDFMANGRANSPPETRDSL